MYPNGLRAGVCGCGSHALCQRWYLLKEIEQRIKSPCRSARIIPDLMVEVSNQRKLPERLKKCPITLRYYRACDKRSFYSVLQIKYGNDGLGERNATGGMAGILILAATKNRVVRTEQPSRFASLRETDQSGDDREKNCIKRLADVSF
jgi:hypothetical protein